MYRASYSKNSRRRGPYDNKWTSSSSRKYSSRGRDDTEHQQQQMEGESFAYELKHDIMRSVYPCNKSGGKQVMVFMDPALNFRPSINLGKPGHIGIKMPRGCYDLLIENSSKVTEFFEQSAAQMDEDVLKSVGAKTLECISLGKDLCIELFIQYNTKMMSFVADKDTKDERDVIFVQQTWLQFLDLQPVIQHLLVKFSAHSVDIVNLLNVTCEHVATHYTGEVGENPEQVAKLKEYLKSVELSDVQPVFDIEKMSGFDWDLAFKELKTFCILDIVYECSRLLSV
jgi:hypothetical protein